MPGIQELPIADAATEIVRIEPYAAVEHDIEIALGDGFTDPGLREHFRKQEHRGPVHSYRLRDVTLDASLMLLMHGRTPIPETRYLVTDDEYLATQIKPYPLTRHDPAEYYVIGCNRIWHNYHHWLLQAVPAIDWAMRGRYQHRLTLVLPPLQPWQEETLTLLGYQDVPRLTLDVSGTYFFPQAEYSEFLGQSMPWTLSSAAVATYRRLSHAQPWSHGSADAIYVARTDVINRVAINEEQVIDLMQREGVQIVVPGSLSVGEQIATFRGAQLVIGPHGAGLSNIVFCQPRSFVYELLPNFYPNSAFNRAAQSAGLNYWADLFEGQTDGSPHTGSWRIDVDVVARRLAAIRAKIAATPRIEGAMEFLKRTQVPPSGERAAPTPEPLPVTPARPPWFRRLLPFTSRS